MKGADTMPGARQPIDLLVHKGKKNLTKEEIAERKAKEVVAPSDNITAPDYLPERLKEKFDNLANELVNIGIMANIDSDSLARYLVANEKYEKISAKLLTLDPVEDMEQEIALSKLQDRYFKQARSSAIDLALTITSRCKIVLPTPPQKDKPPPTSAEKRFGDRL